MTISLSFCSFQFRNTASYSRTHKFSIPIKDIYDARNFFAMKIEETPIQTHLNDEKLVCIMARVLRELLSS